MSDAQPAANQPDSAATRRKKQVTGMIVLAIIGVVLSLWLALSGRGPAADQQLKAFTAAKPEVVSIAGANAPVITADDVIPAFFALNDMATPAEARMAIAPLFDSVTPRQAWLFVTSGWASDSQIKDLESLITDLKGRSVTVLMVLPPQAGETDDAALDALARLANAQDVTFLDYHDASKLGEPLCALEDDDADASMQNEQLSAGLTTQQMLLHMAVNAPATRAELKLADIGARIEKMKSEAQCAPAAQDADEGTSATPAEEASAPPAASADQEDAPSDDSTTADVPPPPAE